MLKMLAHYRLEEMIGAGGMGVVHHAHDTRLERDVALKRLLPEHFTDADARARLLREARAASALSHPNICVIYEVGEADGEVFIAMERIPGRPLADMIPAGGLASETVLRLGIQIADALAHAHERGIVHRDLKTSNVMVTPDARVKVLDFGLARHMSAAGSEAPPAGETLTETGVVAGTPHYVAPELLRGEKADARSDLWALGVLLYEMASGALPFQGRTGFELSAAILNQPTTPLPDAVPPGLRAIIQRCLAKEPAQRYRGAGEVRAALEALLSDAHLPVSGRTAGAWRGVAIAAVALLAVAVVALFVTRGRPPADRGEVRQRQLTSNTAENVIVGGTLSPDGKYLASHDMTGFQLRLLETGDTHPFALPDGFSMVGDLELTWVDWFPDGTRLLVSGTMADRTPTIWALPVAGGGARRLATGGGHAVITRDGSRIAYVRKGAQGFDVWCMDADGQGARRVTGSDSSGAIVGAIAWAPGGQRIVYARVGTEGQQRLESCDLAGRRRVLLADSLAARLHGWTVMVWAPDGRVIFPVFEHGTSEMNLWSLHVDPSSGAPSGTPEKITHWTGISLAELTGVSPDGQRLTVYLLQYQSDCYVGEFASAGAPLRGVRRLTLDDKDDVQPAWLPDARSIVFSSDRNGTFDLYRQALDRTTAEPLVVGPGGQLAPRVTPNGRWILYWSTANSEAATAAMMRFPVGGGAPETVLVAPNGSGFRLVRDSGGGVLREDVGGQQIFSTFGPERGRGREIARFRDVGLGWDLSRDGATIASVVDSSSSVLVRTLSGGPGRSIPLDHPLRPVYAGFGAEGDTWIVNGMAGQGWELMRVDPSGHCTRLIPPALWMNGFAPSPDGRRLAFTRNTVQANLWLLENF